MKKLFFIVLIAFVGLSSQAQFTKATLQATGLTCAMCSNAINKALVKVPFVESVKADIKNSAFHMVFNCKCFCINIPFGVFNTRALSSFFNFRFTHTAIAGYRDRFRFCLCQ